MGMTAYPSSQLISGRSLSLKCRALTMAFGACVGHRTCARPSSDTAALSAWTDLSEGAQLRLYCFDRLRKESRERQTSRSAAAAGTRRLTTPPERASSDWRPSDHRLFAPRLTGADFLGARARILALDMGSKAICSAWCARDTAGLARRALSVEAAEWALKPVYGLRVRTNVPRLRAGASTGRVLQGVKRQLVLDLPLAVT